jgi:flagellar basal body-associated protein FliL
MTQDMSTPPSPTPEPPRKSNTWIIILIVVLLLCCLCVVALGAAWQFGDQILRALGVTL